MAAPNAYGLVVADVSARRNQVNAFLDVLKALSPPVLLDRPLPLTPNL